jgi:hypothetical protein
MKMKFLPTFLVTAVIITMSSFAYFGEIHSGNGITKEEAARNADFRAERAAKKKGTCWTEAKLEKCKKESDGTWTCYASSANHKGSCQ